MTVDKGALESGARLVDAWGQLSSAALVGFTVLGISIVIAVIVYIIFKFKNNRAIEDAKNKRAKLYADNMKKLEAKIDNGQAKVDRSINDGNSKVVAALNIINESIGKSNRELTILKSSSQIESQHLVSVATKINEIERHIEGLIASTSGIMNEGDSAYLIKTYFYKVVMTECDKVIKASLKENDYDTRPEFVSKKVRTRVGNILSEARATLHGLPVSINFSSLFKIDDMSTSERFLLVDIMWSGIKELFSSDMSLDDKYEEATLRVSNIIRDYVSEIFAREISTSSYRRMNSEIH